MQVEALNFRFSHTSVIFSEFCVRVLPTYDRFYIYTKQSM